MNPNIDQDKLANKVPDSTYGIEVWNKSDSTKSVLNLPLMDGQPYFKADKTSALSQINMHLTSYDFVAFIYYHKEGIPFEVEIPYVDITNVITYMVDEDEGIHFVSEVVAKPNEIYIFSDRDEAYKSAISKNNEFIKALTEANHKLALEHVR